MTARREYVWTHDLAGEQNGVIGHGLLDLWHDERLDQSETFGLEVAADNPKASLLIPDGELLHRGRRFYITEIEQSRQGSEPTVAVEANALWYRLGDIVYPGSFVLDAVTPDAGLQMILRFSNGWTAGPSTSSADTFSMEQQDKTVLALLRTWAKITGRALVFDTAGLAVRLVDTRGAELGLAFRYGRNLTGARRRSKPPALTVLYPYGADGLTIAGLNGGEPFVEDFSYYTDQGLDLADARARFTRSRVWSDSSFVRDADLLPAALVRLETEAQPLETYELRVIDLSEITGNAETVGVADRVSVFDPDFDEDVRATVSRVLRHPMEPWRNQIELATILDPIRDASSSNSRPSRSSEWIQFVGPVTAAYEIRNDGDYIVGRIPLAFREGGRANFHLDLFATGVGAGTMNVSIVDAENGDQLARRILDIPYTNGALVRASLDWAREELLGSYDFRVRVTTTATGGPSPTNGVNIAADVLDESSFYVMAQGAVQETPVAANSARYEYTGAVQSFTVPDNVTELEIEDVGGSGGAAAGKVVARFSVIPGTVYDVNVGGKSGLVDPFTAGWPNGGTGGAGPQPARGGGGSSDVRPAGAAFTLALIVAAGSGGNGGTILGPTKIGGAGGFLAGAAAESSLGGGGATQFAGGVGGAGDQAGIAGSFNQGGHGRGNPSFFAACSGGGGGGWYGGGGGAYDNGAGGTHYGGGGGGSGHLSGDAFDITYADGGGVVDAHGYVEFRWDDPLAV